MKLWQEMKRALQSMFGQKRNLPTERLNVNERIVIRIPVSPALVLPVTDEKKLREFVENNKSEVYSYLLRRLTHAIRGNASEVCFFVIENTDKWARCGREEYIPTLQSFIEWFTKTEEYEKVLRCKELIQRCYVNQVIDESKIM